MKNYKKGFAPLIILIIIAIAAIGGGAIYYKNKNSEISKPKQETSNSQVSGGVVATPNNNPVNSNDIDQLCNSAQAKYPQVKFTEDQLKSYKNQCYYAAAINNSDINLCRKVTDNSIMNSCMIKVTVKADDYNACLKLETQELKDGCVNGVAEARNAKIKSGLNTFRAQGEVIYYQNNAYTSICSGGQINATADSYFKGAIDNILKIRGKTTQSDAGIVCASAKNKFTLSVGLEPNGSNSWCIDSTGVSKAGKSNLQTMSCN
jgi:hypothetical protein